MSIFKFSTHNNPDTNKRVYVAESNFTAMSEAMDYRLLKDVADQLTKKIVKDIYPEVIKSLDKELIVKEVSVKVSQEILVGIYGKLTKPQADGGGNGK